MHFKKSFAILVIVLIVQIILVSALRVTYKIELGELTPIEDYATKRFKPYLGYYTLCEQDKSVIPILITNLENKKNDYVLSLSGENWALLPKKVSINAKQKNLLFLSLFPTIESSNTYVFVLEVLKDKDGTKLKKEIPVLVEKCYNIQLDTQKAHNKTCACEPYKSEFKLSNNGKDISVNLTLDAPEWLNIGHGIIELAKDEIRQIEINGVAPCNESGIYEIGLTAHGIENSNVKKSIDFALEVVGTEACKQALILGKDSYTIGDKNQAIHLSLKNIGAKPALYTLESDADWLIITPNEIALKPDEETEFKVKKVSDFELDKEHDVTVFAKVDNYTYSKEIKLISSKDTIFSQEIVNPIISAGVYLEGIFYFYRYYFFTGLVIGGLIILGIIYFVKKETPK